ncbi:hypothetical protein [Georgenia alba]|uniref:ABC transporter family substrate-binding protein n=1 Tax=Georgenia alba TaxID=2233858 RepID=A0ABW2Q4S6_9MICO
MPTSVVPDSLVTVGWAENLTGTNAAARTGAAPGNLDVAALTRSRFATEVEGAVVPDESFGTVTIRDQEPFTVRYDLAEPRWSDGIPLDTADLLLAWAAGSNFHAPENFNPVDAITEDGSLDVPQDVAWFDSVQRGIVQSDQVPSYDEFGRWIEVRFAGPVVDWQTALDVAVPAHVVGARALDITDPMEAKQAVIRAIVEGDAEDLAAIADVWNTGFDLTGDDAPPAGALLSSGPFRIEEIDSSRPDAQRVRLMANNEYAGQPTPFLERVELIEVGTNQLDDVGDLYNVTQIAPTPDNREAVRDLERLDFPVTSTHDGTMWTFMLRTDRGPFRSREARLAFLRAVPAGEMLEAGAGEWRDSYEAANTLLFPPGAEGEEIAMEDSGFVELIDGAEGEPAQWRAGAGVPDGADVCVLSEVGDPFAEGALDAMRDGMAEAGWDVYGCGGGDIAAASQISDEWNAVFTRVPVPTSPAELAVQWGSSGLANHTGLADERRDQLIQAYGRATDPYAVRDARIAIETSLVNDAVAYPIAMNPVVTVADRDVTGVAPVPGRVAGLAASAVTWQVATD